MNFSDKVAVVGGAATGIGRATAILLAAQGAAVVVVDIAEDAAQATVSQINEAGGKAIGVIADLSQSEAVQAVPEAAVKHFGALHYLVNSAGIQTYGTIVETDEALWDRTLNVNLKSVYLMAHYCLPQIIAAGGGAVVNVASVQGHNSSQQRVAAYATSKAAIVALSRSMSLDHAPDGVRVNCVLPGSVDTPLLRAGAAALADDGDPQSLIDEWGAAHPIGRVGQPEEIAQLIAFLLSDNAGFITGTTVTADGGLTTKLM